MHPMHLLQRRKKVLEGFQRWINNKKLENYFVRYRSSLYRTNFMLKSEKKKSFVLIGLVFPRKFQTDQSPLEFLFLTENLTGISDFCLITSFLLGRGSL